MTVRPANMGWRGRGGLVAEGRSGESVGVGSSQTVDRGANDVRPRGAPLEYWFVRVGAGELAFLVDWIIRRRSAVAEVRVSLWVRGQGRLLRERSATWRVDSTGVHIGGCTLAPSRATGEVERVQWDLSYSPGPWRLDPAPALAKVVRPFDLRLIARPRARFTGTVSVDGEAFGVDDAGGTVVHYWGRRLPDSWVWVSAAGVGDDAAAVEAALFSSRLWGVPGPRVTAGYVAVDGGGRTVLVIAPAYGRIAVRGNETDFEVHAQKRAQSLHLTAHASPGSYNDLGEGIHQALLGDLTVDGLGSCVGRAGLEIRGGGLISTAWTSTQ
jgi:hypothetical protein